MKYLLDANVFISAKNLHYGFDFCPGFWQWLVEANERELVGSIESVGRELLAGEDELSEWAKARGPSFFRKPEHSLVSGLGRVSEWAVSQKYEPAAINTFFMAADYYLIGAALSSGACLVTHERIADTTKKIKIANACVDLGIECFTPYEMLRKEKVRLMLAASN